MRITNFQQLATTPLRRQALLIAEAGLGALDAAKALEESVVYNQTRGLLNVSGQEFLLNNFRRIVCVGIGAGSWQTVAQLYRLLGSRIAAGFVLDSSGETMGPIVCCRVPGGYDEATARGTGELLSFLKSVTSDDLVLSVTYGDVSFSCAPHDDLLVAGAIVEALVESPASPREVAIVEKHMSKVAGGGLAKLCYPATVINFLHSTSTSNPGDVQLGPCWVRDDSMVEDAVKILNKYSILARASVDSVTFLETPKQAKYFQKIYTYFFVSSQHIVSAVKDKAGDLAARVRIETLSFMDILKQGPILPGQVTIVFDPTIGNGVAGVVYDAETIKRARALYFNPSQHITKEDIYNFFEASDDLIIAEIQPSQLAFYISQ